MDHSINKCICMYVLSVFKRYKNSINSKNKLWFINNINEHSQRLLFHISSESGTFCEKGWRKSYLEISIFRTVLKNTTCQISTDSSGMLTSNKNKLFSWMWYYYFHQTWNRYILSLKNLLDAPFYSCWSLKGEQNDKIFRKDKKTLNITTLTGYKILIMTSIIDYKFQNCRQNVQFG